MRKSHVYFNPDIGELGEWVAVSSLSGREYFGLTRKQAEQNRADDDRIYKRAQQKHLGGHINWVYNPDQQ